LSIFKIQLSPFAQNARYLCKDING